MRFASLLVSCLCLFRILLVGLSSLYLPVSLLAFSSLVLSRYLFARCLSSLLRVVLPLLCVIRNLKGTAPDAQQRTKH